MSRNPDPTWASSVNFLRSCTSVPAALAAATLAEQAKDEWDGQVICRTSMQDLWFTLPGDPYPWRADVRVSWADGVFEFHLNRKGLLVTADRCREETSRAVLDSFLHQLVAEA